MYDLSLPGTLPQPVCPENGFDLGDHDGLNGYYTQAVLKFTKRITEAQQREAVTRGRSLLPYRLRYNMSY
jgi:hypothetical protein